MNNNQQVKAHRKLKYGTLSIGFVAIVVVLCIAVNLLASGISAKWDLRVDITDTASRFYTISDATKDILKEFFEEEKDWKITIRFLTPEEKVSDKMVLELARSYVSTFNGHVELVFNDLQSDPAFAEEYTTLTQTALTSKHVLVEGKHHVRAINFNAFYYFDSETGEKVSFTGEKTYTAAILRAGLKESPKAVFTVGHGEVLDGMDLAQLPKDLEASNTTIEEVSFAAPLIDSLFDMGFEVEFVDLNKEALPEMTRLVIVCNPKYDFTGFNKDNPEADGEIDILRKFMNQYGTSLIVAVNNATPELPNLMEYMWQEYGINYVPFASVTDNDMSIKGSGGKTLLGTVPQTLAYSVDQKILSPFTGGERFVFNDSVQLKIDTSIDMQGEGVLINSSSSAVSEGKTGVYPLFAFNSNAKAIDDPNGGSTDNFRYKTAYLLGSTDFLSAKGMVSQYANRDLLESVLRVANTVQEYAAIKDVKFVSEALDITTGQARLWTIVVTFVVPLVVFTAAAVVWARRRHS